MNLRKIKNKHFKKLKHFYCFAFAFVQNKIVKNFKFSLFFKLFKIKFELNFV